MDSETIQKVFFFGLAIWIMYFIVFKNPKQ